MVICLIQTKGMIYMVNYKMMDSMMDIFYTLILPFIFVILIPYVNNVIYSVISIGYFAWILYCYINKYIFSREKESIKDNPKEIVTTNII